LSPPGISNAPEHDQVTEAQNYIAAVDFAVVGPITFAKGFSRDVGVDLKARRLSGTNRNLDNQKALQARTLSGTGRPKGSYF